jgi:hypothetical protein
MRNGRSDLSDAEKLVAGFDVDDGEHDEPLSGSSPALSLAVELSDDARTVFVIRPRDD